MPHLPSCCPQNIGDPGGCIIRAHHWRDRKTGPCFPLLVVRCKTHKGAFTLYPPGHRPYGRKAVVPLGPDGSRPLDTVAGEEDRLSAELGGGMFDAALDAAAGLLWDRCSRRYTRAGERSVGWEAVDKHGDGEDRYRSTQERQLGKCIELLGVAQDQDEVLREEVAELLGVGRMLLVEQTGRIDLTTGPGIRGEAVCAVLRAMPKGMRYERLVACGRAVGLWGEALHWDPGLGVPRRLPFRIAGTRAPPGG